MLKNKYDESVFFEKYLAKPRSTFGLQGAGEWHIFQKMLPDFKGKKVLDVGCGLGWHCKYAADNGAAEVLGIDGSEKMLTAAAEKNSASQISYRLMAAEQIDLPEKSFDIIVSSLVFHYIENVDQLFKKLSELLKQGGELVFSAEHPIFTAEGSESWFCDESGKVLHWPVDRYFSEGIRETNFIGEKVLKYHRSLTSYLNSLIKNGFEIREFQESWPSDDKLAAEPEIYADELRRPMMFMVKAVKR